MANLPSVKSSHPGEQFVLSASSTESGRASLYAIYFLSGVSSLCYQVIWFRQLKLVLGNTTYATVVTVSVFLAGLAFGAILLRQWIDTMERKLQAYAWMEIAISVYAALTPLLFALFDRAYVWVFRTFAPSPPAMLVLQLFASAGVLLPPTMLMGATFPLLSSWVVGASAQVGTRTGRLYAANVFGAVAGASATGFFLIRWYGLFNSLVIAVGVNVLAAAAAMLLARSAIAQPPRSHEPIVIQNQTSFPVLIGIWLFLSGFLSLGYEVLWVRSVVHLLQAEIYVFSAVLTVYLLGYTLGLQLGSLVARTRANPMAAAGFCLQLVGLCGLLYLPMLVGLFDYLRPLTDAIMPWLLQQPAYVVHLFFGIILFFTPSVLMGIGFPLMLQASRADGPNRGKRIATAYALNTVGSVLGIAVTGFVLIPVLGVQRSVMLLGVAGVTAGLAGMWYARNRLAMSPPVLVVTAAVLVVALFPANAYLNWINVCEGKNERPVQLVEVVEGVNTTASVHRYLDDGSKVISTAGTNVAGDAPSLRQTQKIQGHVPMILHGSPKDVLTVGFGSGELTRCLTYHQVEKVTCVEIAPEMIALAKRHFSHINLGDQVEKEIEIVYMDAKNFLHLTDRKFDVIMNDSIWPGFFAESSSLYTRDYFLDGKRALHDTGVYSTWLPINLPELSLKSIMATFCDVFENSVVVYPHSWPSEHLLLVGRKCELPFNFADARREYEKPAVRSSLMMLGVQRVEDIFEYLLADSQAMLRFATGAPLNTDDFPVVEFDTGRSRIRTDVGLTWRRLRELVQVTTPFPHEKLIDVSALPKEEANEVLARLKRSQQANSHLLAHLWKETANEKLAELERGLAIDPTNPDLLSAKQALAHR